MFTNNYYIQISVNLFLQNKPSIATSVDTTMIQHQPSPHATVQQKQTGVGKLT